MRTLIGLFGLSILLLFLIGSVSAQENDTQVLTVEANILVGAGTGSGEEVSIQIPDYIFIGNVTVGDISDEIKIEINNTGTKNITVLPELVDSNDEVFRNLYLKRILSEPLFKIGEYHHYISAPSSSGVRKSYCYIQLDLRGREGELQDELLGKTADIRFIATAA